MEQNETTEVGLTQLTQLTQLGQLGQLGQVEGSRAVNGQADSQEKSLNLSPATSKGTCPKCLAAAALSWYKGHVVICRACGAHVNNEAGTYL